MIMMVVVFNDVEFDFEEVIYFFVGVWDSFLKIKLVL